MEPKPSVFSSAFQKWVLRVLQVLSILLAVRVTYMAYQMAAAAGRPLGPSFVLLLPATVLLAYRTNTTESWLALALTYGISLMCLSL